MVTVEAEPVGDPPAALVELGELGVLQVLVELALGELDRDCPARRRPAGGRSSGSAAPSASEDEDLARRVRQVLLGADDVGDRHLDVVDDARQMVEAGAVGALDDVVGLGGPVDLDRRRAPRSSIRQAPSRGILSRTTAVRPSASKRRAVRRRVGPPTPAGDVRSLRGFGLGTLGLDLLGPRVVAVGVAAGEQPLDRRLVERAAAATGSTARTVRRPRRPSSQSIPSQRKPSRIGASASARLRCASVSSTRRTNVPPWRRAKSQLNSAVRTPPMWR